MLGVIVHELFSGGGEMLLYAQCSAPRARALRDIRALYLLSLLLCRYYYHGMVEVMS